jgi:hypothetical protein
MKRRVGAILVRENRILATGFVVFSLDPLTAFDTSSIQRYNGTPRGLTNCHEGGCARCNGNSQSLECVCLHAEENALLEAGRERVGDGAALYCNTLVTWTHLDEIRLFTPHPKVSLFEMHGQDYSNRRERSDIQPVV